MVHPRTILMLWLITISLALLSSGKRVSFKSRHNKEPALSIKLTDAIIDNLSSATVRVHESVDFEIMQSNLRKRKIAETQDEWVMAVNAYTKDMFSGSYKIMLGSQFSDVGDLGDYQQCDDVENAEYNILQLNITKLPLDIRLGLCLPSECNWDKMKKAGESITQSLSKLVKGLANQLNIGLLIDNDVGLQVYFFQPTARNKQANDESGTSASAMGGFIGFLVLLSFGGSIAVLMAPTPVPTHPPENFKKQTAQVEQQQEQEYAERGTAAQTLKTKASQYSRPNTIHNRLGQNEVERERENSLFLNNNIVPNLQPIQEDERESVLWSYIKCFSVQDNLEHLISPKRNKLDDPELDIIEGMKVITLCWGIIMYTSLYVLTSSTRNLPVLLEFFQQFIFALVSSGNKAGDFFFMIITMMWFIKINQLYDIRKGLKIFDYVGILLHGFLKVAPLYYFVFFAGWLIIPMISSGANWFVGDRLFVSWSSDWPFVITFLNTYFPFFTKALEGCYYWPYLIPHYIMSLFFFPIWIFIYRWNTNVFLGVLALLEIAGTLLVGYIAYANKLTVGILTFEDYYLYTYQFNKFHTKLFNLAIGLYAGYLYLRILEYRKASYDEKKEYFRILHFFHNSLLANIWLYLYGTGMLIFVTGIPRSANADGYSWTRWENTAYFALGTTGYLTSVLAFMFIIFFGYGNAMKKVLSSRVWNSLSKIGLGWYLVYPMIITLGFVGTNTSFFISYPSMVYAFVTNIVISFLAGFVLHMVVQAPANGLIRVTKKLIIGERMQTLEKFNLASSEKPPVVQKEEEKKLLATIEQENDDFLTNSQFKLKTKQDV